jgi:hypothetical protein
MARTALRKVALLVASAAAALLSVPFVAMQFTSEVAWGPGDFIAAFVLLFAAGVGCAIAVRGFSSGPRRVLAAAAVVLAAALVWAELAVGILR